jgi:class 3 adenylate cyclase
VLAAPYTDSALANAYREVLRTNTVDALATTDFDRYIPSLNVPTAWIVSPVGTPGNVTGALAVQVPIETINATMTGNNAWSKQGLGETGEVYLAGPDEMMRSISRGLVEHPEDYAEGAIAGGTRPEIAKRIAAVKGTVLLQPVAIPPVQNALLGESGTAISRSYLGVETLASFAPLEIEGVQWVIVAAIDSSEAFAPIDDFTRTLVLSTAGIVFLVTLLSMLFAQVFTRPISRLVDAVNRVTAGERDVQVETTSRDEFASLGTTFNDMSRSLQVKADLLDEQRAENERLLLSLMPQTVADRYRKGDETIAEDHTDVTVIYGDIVGFDDYADDMPSEKSLALLNEIVTSFDEAADRLGVERVRTTKQGYLASCGLLVPRIDSARRAVDFAIEMERILERIGGQHATNLALRAGIDSGTVTSGLVGRSSVVYDMWGEAVSLAYRLQGVGDGSGIFVTQSVVDRLPETIAYDTSGTVETKTGTQAVWKINTEHARV